MALPHPCSSFRVSGHFVTPGGSVQAANAELKRLGSQFSIARKSFDRFGASRFVADFTADSGDARLASHADRGPSRLENACVVRDVISDEGRNEEVAVVITLERHVNHFHAPPGRGRRRKDNDQTTGV